MKRIGSAAAVLADARQCLPAGTVLECRQRLERLPKGR